MSKLPRTSVELGGDPTETSYSTETALDKIVRDGKDKGKHTYTGIPEPEDTLESLQRTVAALKEVVETLTGERGDRSLHALRIGQAVTLNDELLSYIQEKLGP